MERGRGWEGGEGGGGRECMVQEELKRRKSSGRKRAKDKERKGLRKKRAGERN